MSESDSPVPGDVAVLIPAAGSGSRLGGRRKQFRELGGSPVLVQTLFAFERHPAVKHIVVATPGEAVRPLRQELKRVGITKLLDVVAGGETRQASVLAALEATPGAVDVVLIHDAVRPFVRLSMITNVIAGVRETGAASPAISISDTVRRVVGGVYAETVEREGLARMQTPQGFSRDLILEAHRRAESEQVHATDDVGLVMRLGVPVQYVPGSYDNVKITTPDDWERATAFWPLWEEALRMEDPARHVLHPGGAE